MFRLTRYMQTLLSDGGNRPSQPGKSPVATGGPVVIWNLIRRCNLTCKHCYATSADKDFPGELSMAEIEAVMDDLYAYGSRVLILSGGEPLMHPHIFDISSRARDMGFYVGLSTNGTLIDTGNIEAIADMGYDYVGISLDGLHATHDRFRRRDGAFDEALNAVRLCHQRGIKVGLRFTLTADNADDLPGLLALMEREDVDKFYLSHLNYAGRGNKNRGNDAHHRLTREAMDLLFDSCRRGIEAGRPREFVTGNNDADGVYLLHWARARFPEPAVARLEKALRRWGGNASGVNIANIDNLGNVHPDTMWWDYTLGNVRERPFSSIWEDRSEPLMAGLKATTRPLEGRCAACEQRAICGGNSRTRAWQLTGNPWAEDPGCYLTDAEIGVEGLPERIPVTPYSRRGGQRVSLKARASS
ncbi:MAG: heme d1 biosynthesis radical SAM protein NirJ [Gammaproteobacteria bacterium]